MALKFVLSLKEILLFFIFYIFIFLFIFFSIFNFFFYFFHIQSLFSYSFFLELKTRQPCHTYCYQKWNSLQLTEMCWILLHFGLFQLEFGFFQSEFGSLLSELVFLKLWKRVRPLFWKLSHFGFFQLKSAFLNKSSFQNQFDSSRNKHKWSHQLLWLNFSMILAALFDSDCTEVGRAFLIHFQK